MDINATVDVGDNLTSMLERLAAQIGTTADKVFPWYVEQAYLQGITTLVAIGAALTLCAILFVISAKRADFDNGNVYTPISIVSGIGLIVALIFTFLAGPQCVRKMVNPQFYAMTMMAEDVGRLVRR